MGVFFFFRQPLALNSFSPCLFSILFDRKATDVPTARDEAVLQTSFSFILTVSVEIEIYLMSSSHQPHLDIKVISPPGIQDKSTCEQISSSFLISLNPSGKLCTLGGLRHHYVLFVDAVILGTRLQRLCLVPTICADVGEAVAFFVVIVSASYHREMWTLVDSWFVSHRNAGLL